MDTRTRVRACRLIEKLDRHPAFAEKLVIHYSPTIKTNKTEVKK